jgi:hypothetical protein
VAPQKNHRPGKMNNSAASFAVSEGVTPERFYRGSSQEFRLDSRHKHAGMTE